MSESASNNLNQYRPLPPTRVESPCPACGYCPHCGRGGYHTYPWYQPPYYTNTTGGAGGYVPPNTQVICKG